MFSVQKLCGRFRGETYGAASSGICHLTVRRLVKNQFCMTKYYCMTHVLKRYVNLNDPGCVQ